jgi:hypothetical protein
VTVCYLRRFVAFFQRLLDDAREDLILTREIHTLFEAIRNIFTTMQQSPDAITDEKRRDLMDALGKVGGDYRLTRYERGVSGEHIHIDSHQLGEFLTLVLAVIDRTIEANRREDALYHAYNTLHLHDGVARVQYLYPMLEGQVAVLSSGLLTPEAVMTLLNQLRESPLYRADQHSYILYPDRELPGFMEKNTFDETDVEEIKLVQALVERNDHRLIIRDSAGRYHFSGDLRNARDISAVLEDLTNQPELASIVEAESANIYTLFERVFKHDMFTGRSGSFFAYEGLGSIYWHMVAKLLLAIQENIYRADAIQSETLPAMIDAYYDIRMGLGFNKTPDVYGAFPFDPYSHTPRDQGAKQPGMTGMVKEEILTRLGELGIVIEDGQIVFQPVLLRKKEFLESPTILHYWDTDDNAQQIEIPAGAFAFTFCRAPIIVKQADQSQFVVHLRNGTKHTISGQQLGSEMSQRIFAHDGVVRQLTVYTDANATTNR